MKIKILFYFYFSDQTVMPLVNEFKNDERFDCKILVSKKTVDKPFVGRVLEDDAIEYKEDESCFNLFLNSDVIVIGVNNLPHKLMKKITKEKLVFIFSERPYKKMTKKNFLRFYLGSIIHHRIFQKNKPYLLAVGAKTYSDYLRFGNYKNRSFSFGYLPPYFKVNISKILKKYNQDTITICVVGGMYGKKEQYKAIYFAEVLQKNNIPYELIFIGDGPERMFITNLIHEKSIKNVKFLGILSIEKVFKLLCKTQIYLVTAGRPEGFNITSIMAMNAGCVCVMNEESGATKQIFNDRTDSLFFKNDEDLIDLAYCIANKEFDLKKIAHNSYKSFLNDFSLEVASFRFKETIMNILGGKKNSLRYENGWMSPSKIIK